MPQICMYYYNFGVFVPVHDDNLMSLPFCLVLEEFRPIGQLCSYICSSMYYI